MWRPKGRRSRSDEILDLARRLKMAAEEIDAVIVAVHEAEERISARERSANAALVAGRSGTLSGRIGAETINSALDRIARLGAEAESVSKTLKRAAAALTGHGARSGRDTDGGGLSLRRMPPREQAVDRSQ